MENSFESKVLEKLEGISKTLGEHSMRFDSIDKKFSDHDKRLDGYDKKFKEYDKRFNIFEKYLESIQHSTLIMEHEHGEKLQILFEMYSPNYEEHLSFRERLSELTRADGVLDLRIDLLNEKVNCL